MASAASMAQHPPGQKSALPNVHTSGTSAVLEKKNLGTARRSTPDSEALMSSDDDHEPPQSMSLSMHSAKSVPLGRPARRASWLTEVQSTQPRKYSLGGASFTSTGSQPTTPSAENGPHDPPGSTLRTTPSSAAFPWNSQVWPKDRTSRLSEVLPSPTTSLSEELRSPTAREPAPGSGLPFEIPLEPIRKNVRSQSYSAGQMQMGEYSGAENASPYATYSKRTAGLMHRPSRPSMLGEGREALGSLREDEDDVESSIGSDQGVRLRSSPSNLNQANDFPPLRQVASESARGTHERYYQDIPQTTGGKQQRHVGQNMPMSPESADYAVEDYDENGDAFAEMSRAVARTILTNASSSSTNIPPLGAAAIDNRRLESARRSQWQSSLGFDIAEEGSQSRRHSFADLPPRARNGSLAQPNEYGLGNQFDPYGHAAAGYAPHVDGRGSAQGELTADERKLYFDHQVTQQSLRAFHLQQERALREGQIDDILYAVSYFAGAETHRRHLRESQNEGYNPFAVPNVYSRPAKILYIVSFKCKRADIFYIPENTGLQVKAGDTVIVEGDRGQDLGTVENVNVTMEEAKRLRDQHTRDHFRCLMMFSRLYPHMAALAGNQELFDETLAGQISAASASAHGGPGPGHHRDVGLPFESEPRPKMIKRVAKPDEVHLLREKEGNEAKAKRVCQNKVSEHGLRMEILDAEFQHDYRKLTFFYYAEEYINFNDLVTDLFKVYKTRIWMSAINPASYTVMNPNNARAHPVPQSRQPQMGHANYLRQQELMRGGMERQPRELEEQMGMLNLSSPISPMDQDQQVRNTSSTERLGSGPRGGGGYNDAFPSQFQPRFDNREPSGLDMNARYPPFPAPYGPMAGSPWGPPPPGYGAGMPFAYPATQDSLASYGALPVSPAVAQNPAFTPRSSNGPFPYTGASGVTPSNGEQALDPTQSFSRFVVEPRRA